MKKTINTVRCLLFALLFIASFACCSPESNTALWESAIFFTDASLGSGKNTAVVEVTAETMQITLTVKTDHDTVGAALLEHGLIDGKESQYGLYVTTVNGITADYDRDQSYWAFYINGEYATTGVDSAKITEGTIYRLAYTKE